MRSEGRISERERTFSYASRRGRPSMSAAGSIRGAHLGAGANLLICLEKGEAFDECRRFDPQLKRMVLLGAASPEAGDRATAEQLCGPQAAKKLQEHFTQICSQRLPRLQENS